MNKNDNKKIEELLALNRKHYGENFLTKEYLQDYCKNKFEYFLDIYKRLNYTGSFGSILHEIATQCVNYSLYNNYLNKNTTELINGLCTFCRLSYFYSQSLTLKSAGTDVAHIDFVLITAAVNDQDLLQAYLNNKPGPFSKGRTESNIFANSLYLIINKDKAPEKINKTVNEIDRVLELKSVGKYEKAFLSCIKCIITHDYSNFLENINIILKLHKSKDGRYTFHPILKYAICLPVIAFYNLAYLDKDRKTPMPPESDHPLWDSELWHEIIKANQKREYTIDVEKVSPVLKKWMDELPEKIDFQELAESLK
ncbi:MAG: hypothetical protein PHH12_03310 [Candidatus Shapirobacteria bacterium]|nr:hypothetical protein [Candidatus Shapirobacteria bacterium]